MASKGFVGIMLGIVIALSLVGTVATSTSTASTALAAFSGAQALVIIVPLIFVALILFRAYRHVEAGGQGLIFKQDVSLPQLFAASKAAKLQARF